MKTIRSRGKPIPRLAGALPLVGHALEFHRNPVGLIQRGRDRHGNVFTFRLFGKTVHVLTGTAGNEAFFKARDAILSAREAYQFTVPIFGKGVAYDATPDVMDHSCAWSTPRCATRRCKAMPGPSRQKSKVISRVGATAAPSISSPR
jgi:sterol 14-demethylase